MTYSVKEKRTGGRIALRLIEDARVNEFLKRASRHQSRKDISSQASLTEGNLVPPLFIFFFNLVYPPLPTGRSRP